MKIEKFHGYHSSTKYNIFNLKISGHCVYGFILISTFTFTGCNIGKLFRDIDKYYKDNQEEYIKQKPGKADSDIQKKYRDSILGYNR